MNKKNLPIIIGVAVVLVLAVVLGVVLLGGNGTTTTTTKKPDPTPVEEDYKLGMGVVVDMSSSATGNAQVDATVATVVLDKDGKIVLCRLDVAQNKMTVTDGAVNLEQTFQSKYEKGDNYNMATWGAGQDNNGDGTVLEWYKQAEAFENWAVGKTAAQIAAMPTQTLDNDFGTAGYVISNDAELLAAGCTIQVGDFVDAVVKACNDEFAVSFKAEAGKFTLGVAVDTTVDASSKAATADADGAVNMYSDFAASVVADGKILASLNDAIQPKITINVAGEIVSTAFTGTKRELKEGYNMATWGAGQDNNGDGTVLEWYQQSAAFSAHVIGMTAAQVEAMPTKTLDESYGSTAGYVISADDELLNAGCTIQITAIKAVVAKSVTNAR